ncbi:MAG: tetratricopeptide repeat protein, partial [Eudoraea sp.]|nr:tetratricopeptide repeat protein [Eudoraea sp.]
MVNNNSLKRLFQKNAYLLMGFFCMWLNAQDQAKADSLELIYNSGQFAEKDRLQLLYQLAVNNPDPNKSLQFANELLRRAKIADSASRIIGAYMEQGSALRLKGDLSRALESFFEGVKVANEEESKSDLGLLYINIGTVYAAMDDHRNAILNYNKASVIHKEGNDLKQYAIARENLGDLYNLNLGKPDSALIYFKQSGDIFRSLNDKRGIASNLGNVGLAYALKGENDIAEKNIGLATEMFEELGNYYPICVYLTYMSDIYAEQGQWETAFSYAHRSLGLAMQHNLKEQISDAYLKLSELYEKRGNTAEALKYYQNHITYRDSVS